MRIDLEYLEGREIYDTVVRDGLMEAESAVWIATANVKDLRVKVRNRYRSIVEVLEPVAERGGQVRLLHSGQPSAPFMESLDHVESRLPGAIDMRVCPRVHFKAIIIDFRKLYLGSANLTGAGIGSRRDSARNFEVGIWTEDSALIDRVASFFNLIYEGEECDGCAFDCRIHPG